MHEKTPIDRLLERLLLVSCFLTLLKPWKKQLSGCNCASAANIHTPEVIIIHSQSQYRCVSKQAASPIAAASPAEVLRLERGSYFYLCGQTPDGCCITPWGQMSINLDDESIHRFNVAIPHISGHLTAQLASADLLQHVSCFLTRLRWRTMRTVCFWSFKP